MAVAFFLAQASWAAEGLQGNLVSVKWLEKNREAPDVLLIDASPPPVHAKQHIPGAVSIDVFTLASFGVRDLPMATVDRIYQAAGITPGKRIVMYDQGGTWFATRLFFSLAYHGYPAKNLYILDGGMAKWQAEGMPVTKDATPAPKAGTFRVTKVNEAERARLPELVAASGERPNKVLVDALGPEYHYGATAFFNKAGHIPQAVLLPSEDLFNADKTFKSPEEIRRMLGYLSIRPEQEIHSHCGGGGTASVPYFAMKYLAGYPNVKLSLESQMGWLQDDRDLPFWTYAAPAMMRETEWLSSWGGRNMRMYGVSRVSVVDVRPAGAYGQSHVPFALNIPADAFRSNVANPAKLAEILGASGVDASYEAVIVSGSGLTKEAALAYVMLEKMGQKKVSVFMDSLESVDSLDKMARKGFAVTQDPTKVTPVAYLVNARNGITLAEANGAGGAYPKVFIASGASVPAVAPAGTVVHVPYTQLLKADGTPKEAKDLWAILSKAGVPRYAELVAFSDDPGEAAANYFVLKLMGYPDIKVLMAPS
ncbi:hypothetical protein BWI17_06885 [Betaproteobacteria bacterium GR16-43]|nr:hypothetical protein BWI17_06885 [Betaproteobacteria bacterium GR16-43]